MYAVAGGKGGCGKTTTALGLAQALARYGADPLILDADIDMPDLHLLADVPPEPDASALADGAHIECVRHSPPENPGVSVISAGEAEHTPAALRAVRGWHGPVLVDCPAGAGEDAAVPLRYCDGAVLVTTDTPQSLSDATKTATVAERLDAPVAGILIRGPTADDVAPPVTDVPVECLDTVSTERVLNEQRFQLATERLARVLLETGKSVKVG